MNLYKANATCPQDYYPFGMTMPGRSFNSSSYRYGFNGMENDNEIKGSGNSQDFGLRMYDGRLGKFMSKDPYSRSFASQSNYLFAVNNPIRYIDFGGGFKLSRRLQRKYPLLKQTLIAISDDVNSNPESPLLTISMEKTGASQEQALEILSWKKGPRISLDYMEESGFTEQNQVFKNKSKVVLNKAGIERLHQEGIPDLNKSVGLFWLFFTVWHEGGHAGDFLANGIDTDTEIDPKTGKEKGVPDAEGEFDIGTAMEKAIGIPESIYNDKTGSNLLPFVQKNTDVSVYPFGTINTSNIIGGSNFSGGANAVGTGLNPRCMCDTPNGSFVE